MKEYKAVRGEGGVVIRSGRARGKGKEDNRVTRERGGQIRKTKL